VKRGGNIFVEIIKKITYCSYDADSFSVLALEKSHFFEGGGKHTSWSWLVAVVKARGQESPEEEVSCLAWVGWRVLRLKLVQIQIQTPAVEKITLKIL